jgi:DNA-binding transcriptional LysR family regulator
MELRHVKVFLVLSEELHFGRTARRLHVAQSAVSQTLRALEEEIGTLLFTRTKRSVALSAAGRGFIEYARSALAQLEQGTAAARLAASGDVGELRLRFTLMSTLTVLPRVVSRFKREYPRVDLQIGPGGSVEQLEAIRIGQCDIGFMALKRDSAPFTSHVVARSPLVAVLAARHPLARRPVLELAELAAEQFIFLRQHSEPQLHTYFRQNCARAGFEPKIVMEVEQLEPLLSFVAAGVGVACVPGLVSALGFRGIKLVPLRPEVRGGISAIWDPVRLSPTAARFLELLRTELDLDSED